MKRRYLLYFFVIVIIQNQSAQENNVLDAISRMEALTSISEEEFTLQDSYFIGRAVAAHIFDRYAPYTEKPALTNYLNLICGALAINSSSPEWFNGYHVMILDSQIPNAYSTSGGHIFLTIGLIKLVSSEDMLAAVIAHEIAHIQLNHGLSEIKHNRLIQDFNMERNRILSSDIFGANEFSITFNEIVDQYINILFAGGYSQLQEIEADKYAISLLASAGYYPGSLIDVLHVYESLQPDWLASLKTSHPLPFQRISSARQQAALYRIMDTRSVRISRFLCFMGKTNISE